VEEKIIAVNPANLFWARLLSDFLRFLALIALALACSPLPAFRPSATAAAS
jgi:hypothetical protein